MDIVRLCSLSCNEDDLLCTRASPSPLPLLSSGFGAYLSSLNKLNANDGSFKLLGYISGPDVYIVKVPPNDPTVRHVYREQNKLADSLAVLAAQEAPLLF